MRKRVQTIIMLQPRQVWKHATIVTRISEVPRMSFAHRHKTRAINRDTLCHINCCNDPKDLDTKNVTNWIRLTLNKDDSMKRTLHYWIQGIQIAAFSTGTGLKQLNIEN